VFNYFKTGSWEKVIKSSRNVYSADRKEIRIIVAGSVSDRDPDPDWIRIQSGPWIRIRIQGQESEEEKYFNI